MTDATKLYMEDPEALVDVVREVVEGLRAEAANGNVREAEGQLREVSRAIEKMEKKDLPVTDHLRRAKMDLVAQIDEQREAEDRLETLVSGLSEVLGVASQTRTREAAGPKISSERLRGALLEVLEELEGGAFKEDVRNRMEEVLGEELKASDLVLTASGRPSWKARTGRIANRLKREGILQRNMPNGPAPQEWWILAREGER